MTLPRQVGEAPDTPERTTTSAGEYIQVIFETYLASFIQVWVEAAQRRMKAAAANQMSAGQVNPTPTYQQSALAGPSHVAATPNPALQQIQQQQQQQNIAYNAASNGAYGNLHQGNQAFGLQHSTPMPGAEGMQQSQHSAKASPAGKPVSPSLSGKSLLLPRDKKRKTTSKKGESLSCVFATHELNIISPLQNSLR